MITKICRTFCADLCQLPDLQDVFGDGGIQGHQLILGGILLICSDSDTKDLVNKPYSLLLIDDPIGKLIQSPKHARHGIGIDILPIQILGE